MNISNILSAMWLASQGTPYLVVHFQADSYEYKRIWRDSLSPIAVFTYSEMGPLVKLCENALKFKIWILVIVDNDEHFCEAEEGGEFGDSKCSTRNKLSLASLKMMQESAEYLVLSRWLIPQQTPIDSSSVLMCLVVFDDFTNVPLNYKDCSIRKYVRPGEQFQFEVSHLVIIDFDIETLSTGLEEELKQFLNLSRIINERIDKPVQDSRMDMFRRLKRRQIDMALTDFTVTVDRLQQVQFTSPMLLAMTEFLSKKRASRTLGSFGLSRVFDTATWTCFGLVLVTFSVTLSALKHPNAIIVVIATQLKLPIEVRSRSIAMIMFTSGFLISCAFSSGLLSSLSTSRNTQIASLEDLKTALTSTQIHLCMVDYDILLKRIDEPGISAIFQMFAHKKRDNKLILTKTRECVRRTTESEDVISALVFVGGKPHLKDIFVGREPIAMSITGMPMTPGHPLFERVNTFVGSLREMRVAVRKYQKKHFDSKMRNQTQTVNLPKVKALHLSDFLLPLIILMTSWATGQIIVIYQLVKIHATRK